MADTELQPLEYRSDVFLTAAEYANEQTRRSARARSRRLLTENLERQGLQPIDGIVTRWMRLGAFWTCRSWTVVG